MLLRLVFGCQWLFMTLIWTLHTIKVCCISCNHAVSLSNRSNLSWKNGRYLGCGNHLVLYDNGKLSLYRRDTTGDLWQGQFFSSSCCSMLLNDNSMFRISIVSILKLFWCPRLLMIPSIFLIILIHSSSIC